MGAKRLIMFAVTVVLVLTSVEYTTIPNAIAEEATLKITITAQDDGTIRETVVGVIDGREISLIPINADATNPIKSLLEHFQGREPVRNGRAPIELLLQGSPRCLCRYVPGNGWLCSPQGCS
jgi:hypothetical protein